MAEIYRARFEGAEGFSKEVVIKRILPHFSEDESFVAMFADEARLAARLTHPNVVPIFDFGYEDDSYFIAMEYVDGMDLRALLQDLATSGLSLEPAEVAAIGEGAARGLHHAHSSLDDQGRSLELVHRDVSPHNILLSRSGEVKIADFGIAKARDRASQTLTGAIKGKVAYMAPEQVAGREVDRRTDQFALGVVLWECLTGQRLFGEGSGLMVMQRVAECEVPEVRRFAPDTPAALCAIVERMLRKEPGERFEDLDVAARALREFRYSLGTAGGVHLEERVAAFRPLAEDSSEETLCVSRPGAEVDIEGIPVSFGGDDGSKSDRWPALEDRPVAPTRSMVERRSAPEPSLDRTLYLPGQPAVASGEAAQGESPQNRERVFRGAIIMGVLALLLGAVWNRGEGEPPLVPAVVVPAVAKEAAAPPAVLEESQEVSPAPEVKPPQEAVPSSMSPERSVRPPPRPPARVKRAKPVKRAEPVKTVTPPPPPAAAVIRYGTLYLRAIGGWATVSMGGKELGVTPLQGIRLPEGDHVLVLKNRETGLEKKIEVAIKEGQVVKRAVLMK